MRKYRPKTAADRLRFARLARVIAECEQVADAAERAAAARAQEEARFRAALAALFTPPVRPLQS